MESVKARVSSKGQIVIPAFLRKLMKIKAGDEFEVFGRGDSIVLKRIDKEALEREFEEIVAPIREQVKAKGITRDELRSIIREVRESS
ncbi:MAG: AbrB/MazE/SpoVT family DNA-binding domain-containing protein [Euryarchaeota archaeon]|nr:AbrB/MazE/SpoVT family DNA-binding domain-containing protein [Euryarchaeota archaeon]